MYSAGFSEQRQRKQQKAEREKVNIEDTQFRPFYTYNLQTYMCLAIMLCFDFDWSKVNVNRLQLQAAAVVNCYMPRMINTCCNLINLNFQQII